MLEMLSYSAARHVCDRHRTRRIYSWYSAFFRAWAHAALRWSRARVIVYKVVYVPLWHRLMARISNNTWIRICRGALRAWYNYVASQYWVFCRYIILPGWDRLWAG